MATKKQAFPAKLGDCIDHLYKARAARLTLQKEQEEALDKLKAEEEAIKQHIINTFKKSEIEGAKGKVAQASVKRLDKYRPKDFLAVWAWARKEDQPQIFEKRLAQTAMQELIEAKVSVPGVETYTIIDLNLSKV